MTARVLDRPAPRTIEVGRWTHNALRRPIGWAMPMRGLTEPDADAATIWRYGNHDRPFGVELAHFSPEHGGGFVVRRIERQDFARWVHGVKGAFAASPTSNRELRAERMSMWSEAERSYAMLVDLDWTRWALRHLLTGRRGRVRRMRNGSARGRQRFRFAAQDGPLSSVGVRFPNGEQGSLIATDGVVEVSDAELASQLRRNTSLRELTGTAASGAENS